MKNETTQTTQNYADCEKNAENFAIVRKMSLFCEKFKHMKKINLLDKFAMTNKFLKGEISLVVDVAIDADGKDSVERDGKYWVFSDGERVHCRFSEGDSVAVMMNYRDAGLDPKVFGDTPGWSKKPCANEKYMPHKMVIEKVRCIRAQDLTEDEVLRAGVYKNAGGNYMVGGTLGGWTDDWRDMFGRLFNRMFKVLYRDNPWVIVYDVTPVVGRAE